MLEIMKGCWRSWLNVEKVLLHFLNGEAKLNISLIKQPNQIKIIIK